jgi:hypothetical protein
LVVVVAGAAFREAVSTRRRLSRASPSAATQNKTSIVFDGRQARMARLAQSMIATR